MRNVPISSSGPGRSLDPTVLFGGFSMRRIESVAKDRAEGKLATETL
jgi:hypothetical protein